MTSILTFKLSKHVSLTFIWGRSDGQIVSGGNSQFVGIMKSDCLIHPEISYVNMFSASKAAKTHILAKYFQFFSCICVFPLIYWDLFRDYTWVHVYTAVLQESEV
jgi:hypothetical protein